ncbi:phasin family protein [Methylobacterium sp. M6A4_1b]
MNADVVNTVEGGEQGLSSGPEHAPNVPEALLEGVPSEAQTAAGGGEGETGSDEFVSTAPEASDLVEDLTVVPEEAAAPVDAAKETVEVATETVEIFVQALPETGAETLPALASADAGIPASLGKLNARATAPRISEVIGELGEVNTTVLTYLRGESAAAVAHWQALSGAKTPADAIRLQVSEMQRAADASLSCFAALAKRASRFTGVIARR